MLKCLTQVRDGNNSNSTWGLPNTTMPQIVPTSSFVNTTWTETNATSASPCTNWTTSFTNQSTTVYPLYPLPLVTALNASENWNTTTPVLLPTTPIQIPTLPSWDENNTNPYPAYNISPEFMPTSLNIPNTSSIPTMSSATEQAFSLLGVFVGLLFFFISFLW